MKKNNQTKPKKTETATHRKRRLQKAREIYQEKRLNETEEDKVLRSVKRRKYLQKETTEQRNARLDYYRANTQHLRETESSEQRNARLTQDSLRHALHKQMETPEQRSSRLSQNSLRHATQREIETLEQRNLRLLQDSLRHATQRQMETSEEHEARLVQKRSRISAKNALKTNFENSINVFCDQVCDICKKCCYPNQVSTIQCNKSYLPAELSLKRSLTLCSRRRSHVTNKTKTTPPSKAYWNNLEPGDIPEEIRILSQTEQRLLSRIIPFIKIIKFNGMFGQYGFRGQAVLFAQDIFEVADKLPNMLPRSTDETGIVIVTEHLENLNITREFTISRERVFNALRWLIANNPLYKDVTVNESVIINEQDIIQVVTQNRNETIENQSAVECQNLVEENRRLMGLASGMVRGNLIIPANSSNIEAVILQTQVDTLQWQLKQVEASREMYRAVMEEVVRFLERCHRNLENLQNQNQQQQQQQQQQLSSISSSSTTTSSSSSSSRNGINTGNTTIRPRSMHQMTYRHNDINSIIESDSSSIISHQGIQTAHHQQPPLGGIIVTATTTTSLPPPSSSLSATTITSSSSSSSSSTSVLNQSLLSSIFSNQNMSPRARSSTNIIDANNSTTTTSVATKNMGSTLDDDCSSNILLGESASSNNNNNTTAAAISHNNFRDFTWRRSPKRQQMTQLAASASRDVEKLTQEAFRLLRTAQNLLNTQEPDLTQSKTLNPDLSFISNCSSISGSNGILHHHSSTLPNGIQSVVIPSSVTTTLKSNSTTNLDTDPFLISSFSRKVNMRESRLSLRSSTDSSVHSTTSSSSKTETDEENNTTLQQIQNNKINLTNNTDPNKESPVCSSTISSSTTEDESGFSSISSFQEIGLPLHSTIMSSSSILLNNTSSSLSSSNSDESGGNNKTIGGNNSNNCNGETTLILDSRNSTLKSVQQQQQQNLVNGIGLPSSAIHRRWDSAPAVPPRNSLHRFSTVSNNNDEGPTVLWV